jgi:hypothetical protein
MDIEISEIYPVSKGENGQKAKIIYGSIDTECKIIRDYPLSGFSVIEFPWGQITVVKRIRLRYEAN